MKKIIFSALFSVIFFTVADAQYRTERTGYAGDYFSLEGAIELFKESRSLNSFERALNSKRTYVNNLDLNFDGKTDYMRVEHRWRGDVHVIILQAQLGRRDVQDVAVIEIEKLGRRDAVLQIVGDPDIYGEEVIVEPFESARQVGNYARSGSTFNSASYVNVYYWPTVQTMLAPRYTTYVSPYRWSYYPSWWSPWRPYSWNVYYPRLRPYYRNCIVVNRYRAPRVRGFYRPHRSHSIVVRNHTAKIRRQHLAGNHRGKSVGSRNGSERYGAPRKAISPRASGSRAQVSRRTYTNQRSPQVSRKQQATKRSQAKNRPARSNTKMAPSSSRDYDRKRSSTLRSPAQRSTKQYSRVPRQQVQTPRKRSTAPNRPTRRIHTPQKNTKQAAVKRPSSRQQHAPKERKVESSRRMDQSRARTQRRTR